MLTYTTGRNLYGTLTNNTSTANLTLGDSLINVADADIINAENWPFLQTTRKASTVASQQAYGLPNDIDELSSLTVKIGTTIYTPKECPSRDYWNQLNQSPSTSDIPEWYFLTDNGVSLYPIPASSISNALIITYQVRRKDLNKPDYSTGNIVSIVNGQQTVTGSGTTWTDKMAGMWIKITDSTTTNTGDGYWYQILSVQSATSLTLATTYGGTTIGAGSAPYVIGQCSLIPEDFQILPIYKAVNIYYSSIQPDLNRASLYSNLYEKGVKRMQSDLSSQVTSPVINRGDGTQSNPNNFVRF